MAKVTAPNAPNAHFGPAADLGDLGGGGALGTSWGAPPGNPAAASWAASAGEGVGAAARADV